MALSRALRWPLGLLSLLFVLVGCNYNYNEGYGKAKIDVTPLPGLPASATLVSLSFSDDQHGWAAAANCPSGTGSACRGLMFRTSDDGQHWVSTLPSVLTPRKVQFTDAKNGWLIGSIGQQCGSQVCPNEIMMSTDGGQEWDRASAVNVDLIDLGVVSPSDVWVLGRLCPEPSSCHATLATTGSAGQLWANQEVPLKGRNFALQRIDAKTAWIVALADSTTSPPAAQPRLASTQDAGATWSEAASPCPGSEQGFNFAPSSDGWLFCRADAGLKVYTTPDAAKTWQATGVIEPSKAATSSGAQSLAGIVRLSDQAGVAALADGAIEVTRDGGKSWQTGLQAGESLQGVEHRGTGEVWVLGTKHVFRSTDGGQTWTTESFDYHPIG